MADEATRLIARAMAADYGPAGLKGGSPSSDAAVALQAFHRNFRALCQRAGISCTMSDDEAVKLYLESLMYFIRTYGPSLRAGRGQ